MFMGLFETIKQFGITITAPDIIICLVGLSLFACWLLKTSLGRGALADSVPRRNNMPFYMPFIPVLVWFGGVPIAILITRTLFPDLADWQNVFIDNVLLCIGAIATMAVIIFIARASFARRLKGFGLNFKTIHKDFGAAFVNLLTIWPIVIAMIIVTTFVGKLILGQDFHLEKHEELKTIISHPQLPVRILIIVTTVAVIPVFEEMLFRGLFQTMLRSFLDARCRPGPALTGSMLDARNGAWPAIVISSVVFAIVHSDPGHWPALFALSMCMGYAYEKSGSLLRPIFVHSLFNATSIIAALYQ